MKRHRERERERQSKRERFRRRGRSWEIHGRKLNMQPSSMPNEFARVHGRKVKDNRYEIQEERREREREILRVK